MTTPTSEFLCRSCGFITFDGPLRPASPVVIDVGGSKERLVVGVKYSAQLVFIRFVGTHEDYDDIEAGEV